jgi:hypothetical protein
MAKFKITQKMDKIIDNAESAIQKDKEKLEDL